MTVWTITAIAYIKWIDIFDNPMNAMWLENLLFKNAHFLLSQLKTTWRIWVFLLLKFLVEWISKIPNPAYSCTKNVKIVKLLTLKAKIFIFPKLIVLFFPKINPTVICRDLHISVSCWFLWFCQKKIFYITYNLRCVVLGHISSHHVVYFLFKMVYL